MANHAILFDFVHLTLMAKPAIGFRHGVPTSACRDAPLLGIATRIQTEGDDMKNTCAQAQMQCVWAEASRASVEPIHGPRDEVDRLHPKQVRPLLVLPQVHCLPSVHR